MCSTREAWQAKLHECDVELRNGLLDRKQFVQYKAYCEAHGEQSLEQELQSLKLSLLPRTLQQWKRLHTMWAEYESFVRGDLTGFLDANGSIALEEVPLVLSAVGLYRPKSQVTLRLQTVVLLTPLCLFVGLDDTAIH